MFFTVYTPTYNRADLLHRVYDSLMTQDDRDFEWLIIDDGSTDNTATIVENWAAKAPFPVRYVRQANQGKHIATNRAVELAAGEMFVIVDSDDWLTTGSLGAIRQAWSSIPSAERDRFCGVAGLFIEPNGKACTKHFPEPHLDSNMVEIVTVHQIKGEISIATRTEIRRRFPFPENVGRFCMETLVWNRLAQHYLIRFTNQTFQIKDYQEQGLTKSGLARRMSTAPAAYIIRSQEFLGLQGMRIPWRQRQIAMRLLICASLHANIGFLQQLSETPHKLLWLTQLRKGWREYRRHRATLDIAT